MPSLLIDIAKVLHSGRALSDFARQSATFFEILLFFPRFEDDVTDVRGIEGLLILKFGGKVDAVVLADVADGLRWQLLCLGADAHRIEHMILPSKMLPVVSICQKMTPPSRLRPSR